MVGFKIINNKPKRIDGRAKNDIFLSIQLM